MKKGISKILIVCLTATISLALAAGGWYYLDKQNKAQKADLEKQISDLRAEIADLNISSSSDSSSVTAETSDWKTYHNSEIGFSFKFPKNWQEPQLFKHVVNDEVGSGEEFSNYNANDLVVADPRGVFVFSISSANYSNMYGFDLLNIPLNPNWTKEQFLSNMSDNAQLNTIEFYRQLDGDAILVGYYQNIECSQALNVEVIAPLTSAYPNLTISIKGNYERDPIIISAENAANANGTDICSLEPAFKQVADKVFNGTFSDDVVKNIEIARLIANSLIIDK